MDIFVEEHVGFPRASHDDTVDACSQAMIYLAQGNGGGIDAIRQRQASMAGLANASRGR